MHLSIQDGGTALMLASRERFGVCVKELLETGAQVNFQNNVSAV